MGGFNHSGKTTTLSRDTALWIKTAIGLLLMFGFQFIPAPEPVTRVGMVVMGAFFGIVFLVASVNMLWPTFAVLVLFAFHAQEIYSTTSTGLYVAVQNSFGNWMVVFVMAMLLLCYAVEQTGVARRLALWFVTTKFARKSPWTFTFMLLLAALVLGMLLETFAMTMVMILICRELFEVIGYKKGDAWPCMIIAAIPWTAQITTGITPFGHAIPVTFMQLVSNISGLELNWVSYMLLAVPCGVLIWLLMFLYFRFVINPDVSALKNIDFLKIEAMRPGKMQRNEKLVTLIFGLVIAWWLIPGFLSFFMPGSPVVAFFNRLSTLFPPLVAIALMAVIRVDGKPLLDIAEATRKINWTAIIMFAGIIMVAQALVNDSTGIVEWITENIASKMGSLTPWIFVAVLGVIGIGLTQLLNNTAVGTVLVTVCTPVAIVLGIDPMVVLVTVALGIDCAFISPAAAPSNAFSVSDEYCNPGFVFRHGLAIAAIACAVVMLVMYPLDLLILG